jgi:hypothetical protein
VQQSPLLDTQAVACPHRQLVQGNLNNYSLLLESLLPYPFDKVSTSQNALIEAFDLAALDAAAPTTQQTTADQVFAPPLGRSVCDEIPIGF